MEQQISGASTASSSSHRDDGLDDALKPEHKVFLSHSGFQKAFVEHLCLELEGCFRYPFFDKRRDSCPIGENFPQRIFDAIRQCHIGVVILSEEFFISKWPMMELVAMHNRVLDEVEKGKSNFKIIPVFLCTSLEEFDDPMNWSRWLSCWHELALNNPKGIQVEKLEAALKYLRSINGLVYDRLGEIRFQKEIVDEICKVVPPEIKLEDSYIQGRTRLCKVIREKISMLQKSTYNEVCVLGLYGMGGIGKTSVCKALCNDLFTEFRGKVCHAELERGSEEELLRKLLKSLTDTSPKRLDGVNVDQSCHGLEGIIKEPVFLALDNMSDNEASIQLAKSYISAGLPPGSIVMVTARSKDSLMRVRPHVDESKCLEMPELELEEAKSLFAKSSDSELRNDMNEELILRCVKQCYFRKNDGSGGCQYHPLALVVLGRQLARLTNPKQWALLLDRINEDTFNQSRENKHPIFSILRTSFDTLSPEDQLLFMDVALFLPDLYLYRNRWKAYRVEWNVFEWLGIVHRIPRVVDVMRALERLKMKSLLERVGDGVETRIGMHDLWRAFCLAETKYGELRWRRWMYEAENSSDLELVESSPSDTCWENVKRMAFLHGEMRGLERVNFSHFSNVTVLTIRARNQMRKTLVVDLSELIHLKSLEVVEEDLQGSIRLVPQGLPKNLIFLRLMWYSVKVFPSRQLMKQIACLKELQYLQLDRYRGSKLPDMRSMVSLRVAIFNRCGNVVTVTGLSSKLTALRVLDLECCQQLRSCPGVGDLVALEVINCKHCERLERLPNLRTLRNLRKLNISFCNSMTEVPGLGDLVALEELIAKRPLDHSKTLKLPDMRKLRNLQVLDLVQCRLEAVPGLVSLISLQEMVADFRQVVDKPNLQRLTKLQVLVIDGWSLAGLRGLDNLAMLHTLHIGSCTGVDELPEFRSLTSLQTLRIKECEFKDVSGLSNLVTLETLEIERCRLLERLPDLQRLTRLNSLRIGSCAMLRRWDFTWRQVEVSSCRADGSTVQIDLSDSQRLTDLQTLRQDTCVNLADVTSNEAFSQLESLDCWGLPILEELPDLSNFPRLKSLRMVECASLRRLTSRVPISTLSTLMVSRCSSLATLPDLGNFPLLRVLWLRNCDGITMLRSSVPLSALQDLSLNCRGVKELPDLGILFPALETFKLDGCSGLTTMSSSVPLTALHEVSLERCSGLKALPDLASFPKLRSLLLQDCISLATLSTNVPLPALYRIRATGCRSLSRDNLDRLQASSSQQCTIDDGQLLNDDVEGTWRSRLLRCFRG